jgi:HK97 gp10 family phage protein
MPKYKMTVEVTHNRFPEIRAKFPAQAKKVVAATALQIYATANPPRDTGHLAGFVTVTENSVTWHAYYAGFVNYGTRYMEARPFVDEAVKEVQPMFVSAMEALAKSL